jgi:hypothetical protein
VKVNYAFYPSERIEYEIIDGYGTGIKNDILFSDDVGDKRYKSSVKVNMVPLDIVCYPPHSEESEVYNNLI